MNLLIFLCMLFGFGTNYDIVIENGRVMDPESRFDQVAYVGIKSGQIQAIRAKPLKGRTVIDAHDLVVAPGFIDLNEHGHELQNYRFQAHDGVTTSLELELGTVDVDKWYDAREGKAPINFGVSIGHWPVREQVMAKDGSMEAISEANHRPATKEELVKIRDQIERGFKRGALAEGMGINYTTGASHFEIVEMFKIAAKYQASVHVHMRYTGCKEPETGLAALEEVLAAAAVTGAPLHVLHINSMGLKDTDQLIAMVEGAQKQGLAVTAEFYPYTAASTWIESAIFDEGWQERTGMSYHDIQWLATGERLTKETFEKYREEGGLVLAYAIPEEAVLQCASSPTIMVASDGMPSTGSKIHPRGQGTFSRVLGVYVREKQALTLMEALRKMTLMPAQLLEERAPQFKNKGRIRVGADADITVFDPKRVIDKATFEEPLQYSEGIQFVLVNGKLVIKDGQFVENLFPGQPVRAAIQP